MPSRPRSHYQEFRPLAALAPYVECLWVQRVGEGDVAYDQPVLPDGSMDLVAFDDRVEVAGPATRAVTVGYRPDTLAVGVRFRPGAAPTLLGPSAAELRDRAASLDAVWGRAGTALAERLVDGGSAGRDRTPATAGGSARRRMALLVDGIASRLDRAPAVDPAVSQSVAVLRDDPATPVPALAADVGLSERQLRRRVESAVGYSPRTLARIVRFQRFLAAARARRPEDRELAALAADAGFADQAHLTREARSLGGLPPAALLGWEDERLAAGTTSGGAGG
jgi:AraC-like DNA-binding protein